jgi:hypothetical protein
LKAYWIKIKTGQPAARGHAELGIGLVEVVADRARAEKQLPPNLAVGGSSGSEPDNLKFLGCELRQRIYARTPRGDLACGAQFVMRAVSPRGGIQAFEDLERRS